MISLLNDGIKEGYVVKTDLSKKITFLGATSVYPVYRIRLDKLYYNDRNDRIASWLSKYVQNNNGNLPDINNLENYNRIIEEFIIESNKDAFRKTKNNIKIVEQKEPGVVLDDGRIIDGNRRFACLRTLAHENEKFNYFESIIIDKDLNYNAKEIKLLELAIQHGEDSKIEYDPIDRLVGIFNDIISSKLITIEEYARSTNESITNIKNRTELAKLLNEFLEFINAPGQFYIAREMQIYYHLEELYKILKKIHDDDKKEQLKKYSFY